MKLPHFVQTLIKTSGIRGLILLCLLLPGLSLSGQNTIFTGRSIGIYFSSKGFEYDNNYNIPLTQFIKAAEQDKDKKVENIKIETLIALGSMVSEQFREFSGAEKVTFLNENPELGTEMVRAYHTKSQDMDALSEKFAEFDYVLVMSPVMLGSRKNPVIYVRSNRIINRQQTVMNGRLTATLFSPLSGEILRKTETCVDDLHDKVPEPEYDFRIEDSQSGSFLSKLFSQSYRDLRDNEGSGCSQPE